MTLNWHEIDSVLLDMDGTLLDLYFDSFFWLEHLPVRYAQIHQCSIEESKTYLLKELNKNRGTIEWYCVDSWSDKLKVDIAALRTEVSHNVGYRPFAEEFLQHLQTGPQRVVLVTNDHRSGLQMKLQRTGLDQYLDAIVVSHDFSVAKEEQAFWHQMQEVEAFDPRRSLFIDDTAAVLHSAQQYGISHLRYISQPDTKNTRALDSQFIAIDCFSDINQHLAKSIQQIKERNPL
jgi:putative hydrolase of the HAD superfamily